jgi:tryptophan synthase alpha chain
VSVRTVIEKANADGRAALIGYLPVGFPDNETSIAAMAAMVEGGADAVEIGLPYSDPVMDGPTIQAAAQRALAAEADHGINRRCDLRAGDHRRAAPLGRAEQLD